MSQTIYFILKDIANNRVWHEQFATESDAKAALRQFKLPQVWTIERCIYQEKERQ